MIAKLNNNINTFSTNKIKGYITTNTRYITLVEDSIENTHVLKARESELCVLMVSYCRICLYTSLDKQATNQLTTQNTNTHTFVSLQANIHRVYTESLMNPFTTLHSSSKITSKRFDSSVTSFIQQYNGN